MRSGLKSWRQIQNEKASTSRAEKIFSLVFVSSLLVIDYIALAQYLAVKFK